jgi:hypothetical protein
MEINIAVIIWYVCLHMQTHAYTHIHAYTHTCIYVCIHVLFSSVHQKAQEQWHPAPRSKHHSALQAPKALKRNNWHGDRKVQFSSEHLVPIMMEHIKRTQKTSWSGSHWLNSKPFECRNK